MQLVATRTPPRSLLYPCGMSTGPQIPPAPEERRTWHDPITHGSKAAIAAAVFALIAALAAMGSCYVNWSNRSDQKTLQRTQEATQKFNTDVNTLIEGKLNPATESINKHIGELGDKIQALSERVARLEGSVNKRLSSVETHVNRQASLAKVIDPNRALAQVRIMIELAKRENKPLATSDVVDLKNVALELPRSSYDYWQTVAAIINYQSQINQMSGEAPDPAKVSTPCEGMTTEGGMTSRSNMYVGFPVSNCVVDLDTQAFIGTTFKDSVIRYHGGKTMLSGVRFVNCYFIVDIPQQKTPEQSGQIVLFSLLTSPDQRAVHISTPDQTRKPS